MSWCWVKTLLKSIIVTGLILTAGAASPAFGWWVWTPGDTVDDVGYRPDQPIPFSHKLHAGDLKMDCQYCHSAARRSISSGVPPLNTCMGCHKFVRTDRPNIKILAEHFRDNKAIEWVKVHDLPDFVRFTHQRHIQSGMKCQDCHGPVETMEVVEQVAPLQMGWCVGCHSQRGVSIDCVTCHY